MRKICVALYLFAFTFVIFITACGGNGNPVTINLPSGVSATIDAGSNSITLTATGSGTTGGVTYTLSPGCGTLTPTVPSSTTMITYTPPPATITATCMVTITATSNSNTSQKKSITLTVKPITVTLASSAGATTTFGSGAPAITLTATVSNLASIVTDTITWPSITCGTLVQSTTNPLQATYTPPSSISSNCTAAIEVEVGVLGVTVATATDTFTIDEIQLTTSPATSANVTEGQTQTLTATLANDGSASPSVNWVLAPVAPASSCGTLTYNGAAPTAVPSGKAVTFTAPATTCAAIATATSVTDPTKAAAVTLDVVASATITVSFVTAPQASMDASNSSGNSTQTVSVTITNDTTNAGVKFNSSNAACGSFGTISGSSGSYSSTFTAAQDSTLTALCSTTISVAPVASGTATGLVTVNLLPISISISPNAPSYTVGAANPTFTATVSDDAVGSAGATNPGTGSSGVTFSLNPATGCGSLIATATPTTTVTYQVPASACSVRLIATSKADTTKTASDTITVNAASSNVTINPSITIDDTVIGVPSIIYLNPSGGAGPYTFIAKPGLPFFMTFDTTMNAIVGTPPTGTGTPYAFEVEATDSLGHNSPLSPLITVNIQSPATNFTSLIGQYTCLFEGYYDAGSVTGGPYPWAMVTTITGAFNDSTVTGTIFNNPNSSGNNYDMAYYDGSSKSGQDIQGVLTGTYLLGEADSANHGTATLTMTPSSGSPTTSTWAIVASDETPSTQFNMIEMDDTEGSTGVTPPAIVAPSGRRGSAQCHLDSISPSTFATTGNFVFGTSGAAPTGEPVTTVGVLDLSGGSVTAGESDLFDTFENTDYHNTTFTGSSYGAPAPSTGRVLVSVDTPTVEGEANSGNYYAIVYPWSANDGAVLVTALPTAIGQGVFGSGNIRRQQVSSFDNGSLNGPVVLYDHGASFTGAGTDSLAVSDYLADLLQGTGDGSSGITFNVNLTDEEPPGSICSEAADCQATTGATGTLQPVAIASNGRGVTSGSNETTYLYFYNTNFAIYMGVGAGTDGGTDTDAVRLGWLQSQTSTSSPLGNYILYDSFNSNPTAGDVHGLADFASSLITGFDDDSAEEYTQYDEPLVGSNGNPISYNPGTATNGLFSYKNVANPVNCAVITSSNTACLPAQSQPNITLLQQ